MATIDMTRTRVVPLPPTVDDPSEKDWAEYDKGYDLAMDVMEEVIERLAERYRDRSLWFKDGIENAVHDAVMAW